jgi:hypothetical protein
VCTSDAAFVDPAGDATQLVVDTPLPNAPALDILKGSVTFDAAKKALVFHTKLADLTQDPPAGGTGEFVEFSFAYGGQTFSAVAEHDLTQTADDFHIEQLKTTRTQIGSPVTGAFDKKASEVRVVVPAGFFAANKVGPMVKAGSKFTGLAITTRRDVASHLVPNADTAGSLGCAFVVGTPTVGARSATGVTQTTVPAGIDARPTERLAATGSGMGLPLLGLGLLLVAGAARRRATA